MNRPVDVLCIPAEHIDRFLAQMEAGYPFVLTDGARRVEISPRKVSISDSPISETSN